MKATLYKIIPFLFIILIFSVAVANKRNIAVSPAACKPADKSPDEISDENYGCGFHIVFNSTLY